MGANAGGTGCDALDMRRSQAELCIVASKEDLAAARSDSEIGGLDRGEAVRREGELGEVDGGDGGLLGLESDSNNVKRCNWESVSALYSV